MASMASDMELPDLQHVFYVKQLSPSDAACSKQIKLPKTEARKFVGDLRHKQSTIVTFVDPLGESWEFLCTCYGCQYALSRVGNFCNAFRLKAGQFMLFYSDSKGRLRVGVATTISRELQAQFWHKLSGGANNGGRPIKTAAQSGSAAQSAASRARALQQQHHHHHQGAARHQQHTAATAASGAPSAAAYYAAQQQAAFASAFQQQAAAAAYQSRAVVDAFAAAAFGGMGVYNAAAAAAAAGWPATAYPGFPAGIAPHMAGAGGEDEGEQCDDYYAAADDDCHYDQDCYRAPAQHPGDDAPRGGAFKRPRIFLTGGAGAACAGLPAGKENAWPGATAAQHEAGQSSSADDCDVAAAKRARPWPPHCSDACDSADSAHTAEAQAAAAAAATVGNSGAALPPPAFARAFSGSSATLPRVCDAVVLPRSLSAPSGRAAEPPAAPLPAGLVSATAARAASSGAPALLLSKVLTKMDVACAHDSVGLVLPMADVEAAGVMSPEGPSVLSFDVWQQAAEGAPAHGCRLTRSRNGRFAYLTGLGPLLAATGVHHGDRVQLAVTPAGCVAFSLERQPQPPQQAGGAGTSAAVFKKAESAAQVVVEAAAVPPPTLLPAALPSQQQQPVACA